jgi:hypothetical protein
LIRIEYCPARSAFERFEPVAWRHSEIIQQPSLIEQTKPVQGNVLDVGRQFWLRRPDQINSVSVSAKL